MLTRPLARAGLAVVMTAAAAPVVAQVDTMTTRAPRFDFIRAVPGTLAASARVVAKRSSVPTLVAITAATGLLIAVDQQIYTNARHAGDALGLSRDHPESALRIGDVKIFYVPTTIGSALYYLGDGWTTMAVAGTFFTVGTARRDSRALLTASEITQSMFALGVVTQTIKRATGRQTPSSATVPRGRWRPFVNQREYTRNTPLYDAFPSGHLATAMATVTVIAENYPDNKWVRPVGYTLMGVLAYTMVNNGVHWASDYPLALGIGATVGKVAAERGRRFLPVAVQGGSLSSEPRLEPLVSATTIGLRVRW